jgi:hypothetical protein
MNEGLKFELEMVAAIRRTLSDRAQVTGQFLSGTAREHEVDLLLIPWEGTHSNDVFVVEFKYSSSKRLPSVSLVNAARHLIGVREANQALGAVKLALITNATLSPEQQGALDSMGIGWFHKAERPRTLIRQLGRWIGLEADR